ncbi:ABC transporter substrate-binding protein [Saccharopolyspora endophytica]|uniref:Amino acid ABC transporter substrate-binding protein n=1 Tax=Saccharopolyspora endophytica TaxID=543886 RepID=A0ABS5DKQ4_9PSEU|nr:ABC transporter substrate-binding protein [Saccharopolyspora endophytica]MBQ0926868.1 amino acid ABC transporter substrate-binding protein [Saccharopolyspora endophytica]
MPLFRSSTSSAPVQPRSWLRRHKFIAAAVVVVVVAAGLAVWQPWKPCGNGMRTIASSPNCVGIDVDNTSFGDNDATRDLRQRINEHNATVTAPDFVTVVVLDNMTPDAQFDSIGAEHVKHGVAGALTAASRANNELVAKATSPKVKLKLANYGAANEEADVAAQAIIDARDSERIVAVVGLGQSMDHTRLAATKLSEAGLAVVSGMASADNMNRSFDGDPAYIQRFYRITPTNIDAAKAAVGFLKPNQEDKLLLVHDTNPSDIYSGTLADAFKDAYHEKFQRYPGEQPFDSPTKLNTGTRDEYMEKMFANVFSRICAEQPDQVYFAGRGADLEVFLKTIASNGICVNDLNLDIITSDDASSLLNRPLPVFAPKQVRVFYTSVATQDQWDHADPPQPDNQAEYQKFEEAFDQLELEDDALVDGYAMSMHDAVLVATAAARGFETAGENYQLVSDWIKKFDCEGAFSGATGKIAYKTDPAVQGNPVDKAMPILQLQPDGRPVQVDLVWPSGQPFGPQSCR